MSGSIGDNVFRASGVIAAAAAGRTGAVDWQTDSIKTSGFTAATTEGYFCNTTSGAFTVSLPAGVAGSIVAIADYTRTFQTNAVTVSPDGSEKIGGIAQDATLTVEGQSATFVYVDSTEGWINVQETETSVTGNPPYIEATGGTITCTGDYKIHTFTGDGTFCVTSAGSAAPCSGTGSNLIDYLVVAGGAGGGFKFGGGGGGGGYRESPGSASGCYTVSPRGASPAAALPVTATGYPVAVGGGGAGTPGCAGCESPGGVGENSVFTGSSTITSAGGGYGSRNCSGNCGGDGGSGGGGGSWGPVNVGGSGNTPPTDPDQGMDGGDGSPGPPEIGFQAGGGGGGATVVGTDKGSCQGAAANGGTGATSCITASPVTRSGGGGGGGSGAGPLTPGTSPCGSGGSGATSGGTPPDFCGTAGQTNRGGGGGGGGSNTKGATAGGSGVVVIRYKYQN